MSVAGAQSLTNAAYVMVRVIPMVPVIVMVMWLIVPESAAELQLKMSVASVMVMAHPAPFTWLTYCTTAIPILRDFNLI